jgi:bifunctional DNase/RNase
MSVQVELSRIYIREMSDIQIIELTELEGARRFPIVIGLPEAFAIERRLKGIDIARPQTHDLLSSILTTLGGRFERIEINDLQSGTFFAALVIIHDGQEIRIDSRPSDAIALGVANNVPIFVSEHVIEEASADDSLLGTMDDEGVSDPFVENDDFESGE